MNRSEFTIAESIMAFLLMFPAMFLGCIVEAWAIVTMWGWFITPQWGLKPPQYAVAIGVSLLIGLCARTGTEAQEKRGSKAAEFGWSLFVMFGRAPLFVLMGWVAKHWVMQ